MGFLNLCRENLLGPGNSDTVQYIPYKTFVSLSAHSVSVHLRIALNRKWRPLSLSSCTPWRAWPVFSSSFSWLVNCWPTKSAKSTTGWVIILCTILCIVFSEIYFIEVVNFKVLLVLVVLFIWPCFQMTRTPSPHLKYAMRILYFVPTTWWTKFSCRQFSSYLPRYFASGSVLGP